MSTSEQEPFVHHGNRGPKRMQRNEVGARNTHMLIWRILLQNGISAGGSIIIFATAAVHSSNVVNCYALEFTLIMC